MKLNPFSAALFRLVEEGCKRGGREIGFEFDINYWACLLTLPLRKTADNRNLY